MSDIEKIVESVDIIDEIGSVVKLTRTGSNYKGLCPFHNESTPSFVVSPGKRIFKCFGCGKSGNVIQFTMFLKNLDYAQSISFLADKYDVTLSKKHAEKLMYSEKEKVLFEIMSYAANYFQRQLAVDKEQQGMTYLINRGFSETFIQKYKIGYAPKAWDTLNLELINAGFKEEDCLELGLIQQGKNGKNYDFFRERVMFPISNIWGKIVGFGGRAISAEETVKYLNSQESLLFKKNRLLYGIMNQGEFIKKRDFVILTEGYLDTLALHQIGLTNSVAALGTAFTKEHVGIIKKFTKNAILAFDMDKAGELASQEMALTLKAEGFNVKRIQYLGAKDPDEYIKKYGKAAFIDRLKDSKDIFDYLFGIYSQQLDLESIEGKKNLLRQFVPFFKTLTEALEYDFYARKLADNLKSDLSVIQNDIPFKDSLKNRTVVTHKKSIQSQKNNFTAKFKTNKPSIDKRTKLEDMTIRMLVHDTQAQEIFKDININFENTLYTKLLTNIKTLPKVTPEVVSSLFEGAQRVKVVEALFDHLHEIEDTQELKYDIIREWQRIELVEKETEIRLKLKECDLDKERRDALLNSWYEILKKLKTEA